MRSSASDVADSEPLSKEEGGRRRSGHSGIEAPQVLRIGGTPLVSYVKPYWGLWVAVAQWRSNWEARIPTEAP